MSGSLDNLYNNRHTLIDNMDDLINYGNLANKLGSEFVLKPELNIVDEYNKEI